MNFLLTEVYIVICIFSISIATGENDLCLYGQNESNCSLSFSDTGNNNCPDTTIINKLVEFPLKVFDWCCDENNGFLFAIIGNSDSLRGEYLIIYKFANSKLDTFWVGEDWGHNPWKIMSAEIDGDEDLEICIGVWKAARFHPVFSNRLFIYGWDGNQLYPKWMGSRLASPFIDFDFKDLDSDEIEELISLELQKNRKKRIMSYKWTGFGFESYKSITRNIKSDNLTKEFY